MVCSTCGYENQVGNRFCGMCGTPLPHRPLTAPGAQSTASLTRVLTENGRPIEPNGSAAPVARASLDIEPGSPRDQQTLSETSSNAAEVTSEPPPSVNLTPPSRDSSSKTLRSKTEPPQFDLVPEIPLDEYVQNFRYVPPSEPDETSMRGETQVLEPEVPAPSNTTSVTSVDTAIPSAEATPPPAAEAPPTPAEDDVRERLGLEVESDAEQRSDRPRFLDFNDPPTPPKPVESATPIAGPSFLGLTDVPPVEAEAELERRRTCAWEVADLAGYSGGPGIRLSRSSGVAGTTAPDEQWPHRSYQDEDAESESRKPAENANTRIRIARHCFGLRFQTRDTGRATVPTSAAKFHWEHRDSCHTERCGKRSEYECCDDTTHRFDDCDASAHGKSGSSRTVNFHADAESIPAFCWAERTSGENRNHNRPRGQIEVDCVTAVWVGRHNCC